VKKSGTTTASGPWIKRPDSGGDKIFRWRILFLFVTWIVLFAGANRLGAEQARPDPVIIIAVDTLRADRLGCYGYPRPTSPELDALAEKSVLFTRCFTPSPLTTPAFASLLTSMPPHRHGAKRNGLPIFPKVETLTDLLKARGYRTGAFISSWPLKAKLSGLDRGFDTYEEVFDKKRWLGTINPEGRAPTVNERVFEWLDRCEDEPFFLWVHYSEPHAPYLHHEEFDFDYNRWNKKLYHPDSDFSDMRNYDTEVGFVDHHIGRLIDRLGKDGLFDRAIVVFMSDHGESFGEHGERGHGRKLFNATLHVPLMVKLPRDRRAGTRMQHEVSLEDVAPTLLELLGLDRPDWMIGRDLFIPEAGRAIFSEAYKGAVHFRRGRYYHHKVEPIAYSLVQAGEKLMLSPRNHRYRFFDWIHDPLEKRNLYLKRKSRLGAWQRLLKGYVERVEDYIQISKQLVREPGSMSEEDMEKLKTLGYF
jgi:arylsulfatase A-like enzyme